MIQPQQFKLKCAKCGYCKIVYPKSDALNISEIISFCPKCKIAMERKSLILLKVFLI